MNAGYLRAMGRVACIVLCFCVPLFSNAQVGATDRDALIERSAGVRARMIADSVPMTAVQVDTLQAMAARSREIAAIRLLQQALIISDSIQDLARERDVLIALGVAYERASKAENALQSTRAAHFLSDSLISMAHAQALGELRGQQEAERLQWEGKKAAQEEEMQVLRDELEHLRHRQQQTYGVAGALVVVLLIVMGLVLFRVGRMKRTLAAQAASGTVERQEPRRNKLRPTGSATVPVQETPATEPDLSIDADDAVLLSLFRKRMPERLQALKEARSRGDHEKVLRVITSVRPQLVHHDAERFTERCARLIAAGPTVLEEGSRNDLDGLIDDLERALGGAFRGK
jgi:hypothetical protein